MDWSKYSSLKSKKLASLGKEKQVMKEAVQELSEKVEAQQKEIEELKNN